MSHFTEGVLQAYLDGEVDADTRANVDAHVSGCATCADRLQELRELAGTFASALLLVEAEPVPAVNLEQLRFRSRQRSWSERLASSRPALARAAMLVLGITFAAAAAVPGSPLQDWLIRTWKAISGSEQPVQETVAPVVGPRAETPPGQIGVLPAAGKVRISLQSIANGTRVQVLLADSMRARVDLHGAAATASFGSSVGRIDIKGGGVGDLIVTIPRTVTEAVVEVDGTVMVSKVGTELRYHGASPESTEPDIIFRHRRP